jgi:prophage regulatory protein
LAQRIRFISPTEVENRTSLSRRSITRKVADGQFPKPIAIVGGTRIAFVEAEIDSWIADQVARARRDLSPTAALSATEPTTKPVTRVAAAQPAHQSKRG